MFTVCIDSFISFSCFVFGFKYCYKKGNNGFVMIEQGAFAYGTIIKSSSASMFGAKGALELSIDSVEGYNGIVIPLTAKMESGGSSSSGAVIASALLISPLAIFFRGSNAVVEAGTSSVHMSQKM